MYPHHTESIRRTAEYFESQPEVQALLLGGSIAHGFAGPTSDVDVMIVVSEESYEERRRTGQVHFFNRELCTYPEGYVDGKYLRPGFLSQAAADGSEPARFAFQNAQLLFSRIAGLAETVQAIACYPSAGKPERLRRFYAQFEAWHWYTGEALRLDNRYLLGTAVSKLVLFGGRLILAHNELLYPYHKWFLRVLEGAPDRPSDLLQAIASVYAAPTAAAIGAFYEMVKGFQDWPAPPTGWPAQFMIDSELNWQSGPVPIDDI